MTRVSMELAARYRHTSGAVALLVDHQRGRDHGGEWEYVSLVPAADPREHEGHPFEVKQQIEKMIVKRDPFGPDDPVFNGREIEIPGRFYADPIKVSRAVFDAEWVEA